MLNSILTTPITLTPLLIVLGCALLFGMLTSLLFTHKQNCSAGFALTLALLPLTVTVIILLVNGNIGAGVAVAGAFTLIRFRSEPGSAREISAIFTDMALGLALGMGYVAVAALLFVLTAVAVLFLTGIRFGEKRSAKILKITIPENADYNTLFEDVFRIHNIQATIQRVRTTNMGTLIEVTFLLTLPSPVIPKAFLDDLRVRNSNLNIIISPAESKDSL